MRHTASRRRLALPGLLAVALALAVAACGSDASSSSSGASSSGGAASSSGASGIALPASVKSAGKVVVCSDMTYPPEEYLTGNTPMGSDVEIGTAMGKLLGVQFQFQNTGFDGIIAALLAKRCDVIISGLTQTPERAKQIDFVHYMDVGMSLLVKKGNPAGVTNLDSLSGKTVAVETGTTEKDVLAKQNKKFASAGKPPVKIQIFAKDTDAAQALATGKVDAYFTDAPPAAYYIKKAPDTFAFGGPQLEVAPIGFGLRKDETELQAALEKAVHKLYADGTIPGILKKWQMSDFAIKA
jgi:polar amino acid transport system substrate-binding protein